MEFGVSNTNLLIKVVYVLRLRYDVPEDATRFRKLARFVEETEEFDGVFTPKVGEVEEDDGGVIFVELISYIKPGNEDWLRRLSKVAQTQPGSLVVEEGAPLVWQREAGASPEKEFTELFLKHIDAGEDLAEALGTAIEEHRRGGFTGSAEIGAEHGATETVLPESMKDEVRPGSKLKRLKVQAPPPPPPPPPLPPPPEEPVQEEVPEEAKEMEEEEEEAVVAPPVPVQAPRRRERPLPAEVDEGELPTAPGDELEQSMLSSIMRRLHDYEEKTRRHDEVVELTRALPAQNDGDATLVKVARERGKPLSLTELYAGLFARRRAERDRHGEGRAGDGGAEGGGAAGDGGAKGGAAGDGGARGGGGGAGTGPSVDGK